MPKKLASNLQRNSEDVDYPKYRLHIFLGDMSSKVLVIYGRTATECCVACQAALNVLFPEGYTIESGNVQGNSSDDSSCWDIAHFEELGWQFPTKLN